MHILFTHPDLPAFYFSCVIHFLFNCLLFIIFWFQVSVSGNMTVGTNILISHSLPTDDHWFWIGVGVLLAYSIFFNIMFTLALAFLNREY